MKVESLNKFYVYIYIISLVMFMLIRSNIFVYTFWISFGVLVINIIIEMIYEKRNNSTK
jgi:hypothetical protein